MNEFPGLVSWRVELSLLTPNPQCDGVPSARSPFRLKAKIWLKNFEEAGKIKIKWNEMIGNNCGVLFFKKFFFSFSQGQEQRERVKKNMVLMSDKLSWILGLLLSFWSPPNHHPCHVVRNAFNCQGLKDLRVSHCWRPGEVTLGTTLGR